MSDALPTQHESAVAVVRDQVAVLDAQIQCTTRKLEIETAQRETLLDLIATLSRKPRVRTPRAVTKQTEPANDAPEESSVRPTVFASPSLVEDAA